MFTLLVIAFVAILISLAWNAERRWRIKGIPGPPGLFLIGNVLDLGGNFCKTWIEWKKIYGAVFQIRVFNMPVIILNDKESTAECFNKTESAGRLGFPAVEETHTRLGRGISGYTGKPFEEMRNFFMKSFKEFGMTKELLDARLRFDIEALLEEWTANDGAFFKLEGAFNCFVVNSVWNLLSNKRFDREEATTVIDNIMKMANIDSWGRKFWIMFPKVASYFLQETPIKQMLKMAEYDCRFIEEHQRDRVPGQPRDVLDKYLDKIDSATDPTSIFYKPDIRSIIAAMRDVQIGATTTTTHSFEWTVIYGCHFPETVRRLQEEIDAVIGPTGTPSLNHKEQMPYAEAFILEATRMASVTPFGVPHSAIVDFEFRGSVIPKDTLIISNNYGINYDPEVWPEPHLFKPERFLDSQGLVDLTVKNRMVPFGSGKRSCIGQVFAVDQSFLVVVSMYQRFTFFIEESLDSLDGIFGISMATPKGVRFRAVLR